MPACDAVTMTGSASVPFIHQGQRFDVERNADAFVQAPGLPFSKVKRQSGRRNGEKLVEAKLLPRKASIDVSHVPQHGRGDDRSGQESQRMLQSSVRRGQQTEREFATCTTD